LYHDLREKACADKATHVHLVGFFFLSLTFFAQHLYADIIVVGADYNEPIPLQGTGQAWMVPVYLSVPHITHAITDINVYLEITHDDVSDLEIYLQAPSGTTITLKNQWAPRWRNPRKNLGPILLDDQANQPITEGTSPYKGSFRPETTLSAFHGQSATGQWSLQIYDAIYADTGTLLRWELHIQTLTPEPLTIAYLALASLLARHIRKPNNAKSRAGHARHLF